MLSSAQFHRLCGWHSFCCCFFFFYFIFELHTKFNFIPMKSVVYVIIAGNSVNIRRNAKKGTKSFRSNKILSTQYRALKRFGLWASHQKWINVEYFRFNSAQAQNNNKHYRFFHHTAELLCFIGVKNCFEEKKQKLVWKTLSTNTMIRTAFHCKKDINMKSSEKQEEKRLKTCNWTGKKGEEKVNHA